MDSASSFEEAAAIKELIQGIQWAQKLMLNLHAAEAREFFIPKILSSYHKATSLLKHVDSGGRLPAPVRDARSEAFVSDQRYVSRKRKGSSVSEDQVEDKELRGDVTNGHIMMTYEQTNITHPRRKYRLSSMVENCLATEEVQRRNEKPTLFEVTYKGKHTYNHRVKSMTTFDPTPASTEIHAINSTYQYQQLSTPNPSEILSNQSDNLSVNTSDLVTYMTGAYAFDDGIANALSFPSTTFGPWEEYSQVKFQSHTDDELMQDYLQFIDPSDELTQACLPLTTPATPNSKFYTELENLIF